MSMNFVRIMSAGQTAHLGPGIKAPNINAAQRTVQARPRFPDNAMLIEVSSHEYGEKTGAARTKATTAAADGAGVCMRRSRNSRRRHA